MYKLYIIQALQKAILFTIFAFPISAMADVQDGLEFKNVWISEAPPGSQVMAAYMDIKNTGSNSLVITSPESNDFKKIEFHRTFHENGMARMQHQPEIVIPDRKSTRLNSSH